MIKDLKDLVAAYWGNKRIVGESEEEIGRWIRKRLFRDTECGVGFSWDERGVKLVGYVEGTSFDLPTYRLEYPFDVSEFERIIRRCEEDSDRLYEEMLG